MGPACCPDLQGLTPSLSLLSYLNAFPCKLLLTLVLLLQGHAPLPPTLRGPDHSPQPEYFILHPKCKPLHFQASPFDDQVPPFHNILSLASVRPSSPPPPPSLSFPRQLAFSGILYTYEVLRTFSVHSQQTAPDPDFIFNVCFREMGLLYRAEGEVV